MGLPAPSYFVTKSSVAASISFDFLNKLKSNFNIRDFHEIILSEGTVTLAILESRVLNYIQKTKDE